MSESCIPTYLLRSTYIKWYLYRDSRWQDGANRKRRRDDTHGGERVLRDRDLRLHRARAGPRRHGLLALHEELRPAVCAAKVRHALKPDSLYVYARTEYTLMINTAKRILLMSRTREVTGPMRLSAR